MRIYLDVSCLNRPFDDRSQTRVRLEAEAVAIILEQFAIGEWGHVSSEMALIETDAISDPERRERIVQIIPEGRDLLRLNAGVLDRGSDLETLGFRAADAVHIAAAEAMDSDILLSCDDRMVRRARRLQAKLRVRVTNPLDWIQEIGHDLDTR